MDTIITTTLRETLRTLPLDGVPRGLALRRAAEACAGREAASALDAAACASGTGIAGDLLKAANAVQQNGRDAATARESLRRAVSSRAVLDVLPGWTADLREVAGRLPGSGACTVATALQLWTWTARHFLGRTDRPETVIAELAESLATLVAARCQVLAAVRPRPDSSTPQALLLDLCHLQSARTAGSVSALCAELVHGYQRHPAWDADGCAACYGADELDELEGFMPGFASTARAQADVIEADGSHAAKAGPCVRFNDIEGFTRLRAKLDGCLTGARVAGDRAAAALADTLATSPRN